MTDRVTRAGWSGMWFLLAASASEPLELDARRRIFEYVKRYPGMHMREVARALDMNPNHAKYHLQRLEKADLVSSRREDGYWRFWPRESGATGFREKLDRGDKEILSLLRRPVPLHLTLLLMDMEEANHGELLERTEVSHSTLHYHLRRMEQGGLVVSRKQARERIYRLEDPNRVRHLLQRYKAPRSIVSRFLDAWEQLELSSDITDLVASHAEEQPEEPAPEPVTNHEAEPEPSGPPAIPEDKARFTLEVRTSRSRSGDDEGAVAIQKE